MFIEEIFVILMVVTCVSISVLISYATIKDYQSN